MSGTDDMPPVLLGEASWRDAPDAAVRPHIVVVAPPVGDGLAGLLQRLKPALVRHSSRNLPLKRSM
jgi:hypothetical protein